MAATEVKNVYPLQNDDGTPFEIQNGKIAGSMGVLMPNSLLYRQTSTGLWAKCDTSDATSGQAFHGMFVGLPNTDSTWPIAAELAASTAIRVLILKPGMKFAIKCENNGTDAAAPQAIVGNDYGITISATSGEIGYATLDLNSATNVVAKVVEVGANLDSIKYDLTSAPGTAIIRFLPVALDAEKDT